MLLALLLLATEPAVLTELTETTVTARRPSQCSAAIALRDHVPLEQKLGTQAFTVPHLSAAYDHVAYLTADEDDDARTAWRAALDTARRDHCVVDLFFLAHGDDFVSWYASIPVNERPRLRFVYDTGAGDLRQGARWIDEGARSFVGHPGGNVAPVFYAFFLPAFLDGARLDQAVARANERTKKTIDAVRSFLADGEPEQLWRGTRAEIVGDVHLIGHRP